VFYQNVMGIMYNTGIGGVEKNTLKAIYWFKKAADKDYYPAIINLGTVYYHDIKYPQAIEQYRRLIDDNNPHGFYLMAVMYKRGDGVAADADKAFLVTSHDGHFCLSEVGISVESAEFVRHLGRSVGDIGVGCRQPVQVTPPQLPAVDVDDRPYREIKLVNRRMSHCF
jgi:tetratricopeptide (TPR) repeat protein